MANQLTDELARLDWLLGEASHRIERAAEKPLDLRIGELEAFIASMSLVRQAFNYGRAVSLLLHEGSGEAVAPLSRAIYEVWVELRYLLNAGSRAENARRLMLNATMEIAAFSIRHRRRFGGKVVRGCIASLRSYKDSFPDVYSIVWSQRRSRRFHWSGLSRSSLEQKVAPGSFAYQTLSWDAHTLLSPIRDVDAKIEGDAISLEFGPAYDHEELVGWHAYNVGGMVFHAWNEFAETFGFESISCGVQSESVPPDC